ncbi:hypothetical protein RvY_03489 [Ramazzottius varieornatus]|uniref:G/T mismatch-specific thymine DNA glycosylase n=1 Tax=Ramazzottius varieornatus TaxID=947166 RepID=A0A1D1UTY9_RAMVA|nr:hypothetical protein RvY_03489 [Ramazzottius varieornatus]
MAGSSTGFNFARFAFQPSKKPPAGLPQSTTSSSALTSGSTEPFNVPVNSPTTTMKQIEEGEGTKDSRKRTRPAPKKASKAQKVMETLQDVRIADKLREGLDIIIVGFNPGRFSATRGHNYANPANHFWPCLYRSGLVPEPLTFNDDDRITEFGIGLTNIVGRPTAGSADITKAELKEGALELRRKILQYRPRIVAFNGLGIYEAFYGKKYFQLGRQEDYLQGTDIVLYVMPSSSPRGSKWPRLEDKLRFYEGLAHLRDFLNGKVNALVEEKVIFPK